jgi:transcriptional regulator
MRARGLSHGEIARELQVSRASISSDVQYLREQAKESIREYVTEHLPEQYQVCLSALDTILKHAFEILETSDNNQLCAPLWFYSHSLRCKKRLQ